MHCGNGKVFRRVVQLFEVSTESDFSHHIETVISCPLGDIDTLILAFVELFDQYVDFSLDLRLVTHES